MIYKMVFTRDVIQVDEVVRYVEAASEEEAHDAAYALADEFDRDVPDDYTTSGYDTSGSFSPEWETVAETGEDVPADAEVIQAADVLAEEEV